MSLTEAQASDLQSLISRLQEAEKRRVDAVLEHEEASRNLQKFIAYQVLESKPE